MKTSTLIYNPIAGRHPARREKEMRRAAEVLREAGISAQLAPTTGPGTAEELARAAVQRGDELILVCGGDGTINEALNGVAPSQVPLGVLPGGTANILAKELRLPHDPVRAAAALARWKPRRIALGRATWNAQPSGSSKEARSRPGEPCRRYFVSVAGVGFDAHIVYKLSSALKMSWGVAGYVYEAFRQAFRYPFPPFTCQMNNREIAATFAVLHRTKIYAGWLHLAPTADLFDSRLTVCCFPSRRWTRYLLYAATVLARQHLRLRDVSLVEARKISCAAIDPTVTVHFEVDGELAGTLPATFEVVPDALTLLVP